MAACLSDWHGGCNPPPRSPQNLRQHVGQDADGVVVVLFHGGAETDEDEFLKSRCRQNPATVWFGVLRCS